MEKAKGRGKETEKERKRDRKRKGEKSKKCVENKATPGLAQPQSLVAPSVKSGSRDTEPELVRRA